MGLTFARGMDMRGVRVDRTSGSFKGHPVSGKPFASSQSMYCKNSTVFLLARLQTWTRWLCDNRCINCAHAFDSLCQFAFWKRVGDKFIGTFAQQ